MVSMHSCQWLILSGRCNKMAYRTDVAISAEEKMISEMLLTGL